MYKIWYTPQLPITVLFSLQYYIEKNSTFITLVTLNYFTLSQQHIDANLKHGDFITLRKEEWTSAISFNTLINLNLIAH